MITARRSVSLALINTPRNVFIAVLTSHGHISGESRVIGDKYHETKLFAQFLRVARDLTKVDKINNNTEYASTPLIYTTELRNPDTNAGFYVTIHTSSPSTDLTSFKLSVSTSAGNISIPVYANDIVLNGRQSKIIVTDFKVGQEKLIYSTAEVLTLSIQEGQPILFLWLPEGESGEFMLAGARSATAIKQDGCSNVRFETSTGGLTTCYVQLEGSCVFEFDNGLKVVVVGREAAYNTWMPTSSSDPYTPENSTGTSVPGNSHVGC